MPRNIEDYSQKYLKHDFENILVEYRYKKVLEILSKYKPKNILEIGCGNNSICNYYKDYDSFTIVEPCELFCKNAINSTNKNIEIINDFIENQINHLQNKNVDFIILSCLLHEVSKPKELLSELSKLCNKNTILHVNVPNSKSFHLLWAYESGLIKNIGDLTPTGITLQQNTTFDIDKLKEYMKSNDFEIIDYGSYFIKPFNHSKMSDCIKNGIIDDNLLDGLFKMEKYLPELGAEIFVNCKFGNYGN